MVPELLMVSELLMVTVIPLSIVTVSPALVVGTVPPQVAGSVQSPFCAAVNVDAYASWVPENPNIPKIKILAKTGIVNLLLNNESHNIIS